MLQAMQSALQGSSKVLKKTSKLWYYKVKKLDQHIYNKKMEDLVYSELLKIAETLPLGGRLILDFKGVKLISPVLLSNVVNRLEEKVKSHGHGLFRGRFLVVKDPNKDILKFLNYFLKEKQASLLIVYTDSKNPKNFKEEILNLPPFLRETYDIIIENHGPISAREVEMVLGPEKGASARERLRQLYRRGLVKRKAMGTIEGKRFFTYEVFKLSLD